MLERVFFTVLIGEVLVMASMQLHLAPMAPHSLASFQTSQIERKVSSLLFPAQTFLFLHLTPNCPLSSPAHTTPQLHTPTRHTIHLPPQGDLIFIERPRSIFTFSVFLCPPIILSLRFLNPTTRSLSNLTLPCLCSPHPHFVTSTSLAKVIAAISASRIHRI